MISPQAGDHSSDTQLPATTTAESTENSTTEIPCFDDSSVAIAVPLPDEGDSAGAPHACIVKPLSDVLLEQQADLVLSSDEDAAEIESPRLESLAPLVGRPEPLMWVFAGMRPSGDDAFGDGRLAGEWFAEEWRAESGRATDMVLDATWPGCNLATLKSHLKTRIVRHRPDVAVLFFDHTDAAAGIEELPQFERRLLAVLSVLAEIGAATILIRPAVDSCDADIDREVYSEALAGIAKERGVTCLTLPPSSVRPGSMRTPNSEARNLALYICREAQRVSPGSDRH